ncbi:N-acetyltransferase family protein [Falsiroseomonas sp. HC035]|uniref:GNAT family N-acetyltransferase n=1 Tax=Falsiroseomonas sp. HC035 TaxID=3390999 RepID=UPI003D314581
MAQTTDTIRLLLAEDLPVLIDLINATGLFPGAMLADMAAPGLAGAEDAEFWLVDARGSPVALAYCAPERMTQGTWNLLLIAVHPARQGQGHGTALLRAVERRLAEAGHHLLLVETSALPEFEASRAFYLARGFAEEARIRDFYRAGEDKVVYRKRLP